MADSELKGAGLTADEALSAWLGHLAHERRLAANTLEAYGRIGRLYLAFLQRHRGEPQRLADLGTVSAAEVRAHLAERRSGDHPLAARSISQTLSAIRAFHAFLDRRCATPAPQMALVRGPRIKASLPRPVSEDQARGLMREPEADPDSPPWEAARDRAVLTLLYGCGLRISEGLSLTRADAPVPETLRITGKGGKTRLAPVLPVVRSAVNAYLALQPFPLAPDDALFRARRGGPLTPRHVQAMVSVFGAGWACRPRPRRMPCATASPPTCSVPVPTCEPSRNCWATRAFRRPRNTRRSTPDTCLNPTRTRTHDAEADGLVRVRQAGLQCIPVRRGGGAERERHDRCGPSGIAGRNGCLWPCRPSSRGRRPARRPGPADRGAADPAAQ